MTQAILSVNFPLLSLLFLVEKGFIELRSPKKHLQLFRAYFGYGSPMFNVTLISQNACRCK